MNFHLSYNVFFLECLVPNPPPLFSFLPILLFRRLLGDPGAGTRDERVTNPAWETTAKQAKTL